MDTATTFTPCYERWRHGGWGVVNIRYPAGHSGCVSNNFTDKKWRIISQLGKCEDWKAMPTYKTRDAAARAEYLLVEALKAAAT